MPRVSPDNLGRPETSTCSSVRCGGDGSLPFRRDRVPRSPRQPGGANFGFRLLRVLLGAAIGANHAAAFYLETGKTTGP